MKNGGLISCSSGVVFGVLFCSISFCYGAQQLAANQSTQSDSGNLPVLTTAEQVHRLTREEAGRGYRATLRGVVTCSLPDSEAVVIQDSTRGIYVSHLNSAPAEMPQMGDLLELEGVTDPGEFAPSIVARRVTQLGVGDLPQPIRPAWDQLINGSLDTQYVEMQGIVTSIRADGVTLLGHGGKLEALLLGTNGVAWTRYKDSLIRLRGCLFASWDARTHQVRLGEIRMFAPFVTVEEPAPADVFAIALKRAPELLLFDPQASALRRTKVQGQIVHERDGEFYMMDGTHGLRFIPRETVNFQLGDIVEVVGFPSLTGPSPILREAVARKSACESLPEPKPL